MQNTIAYNHVQFDLVNSFMVNTSEHVCFHFTLLIKCCFSVRQLNYYTGFPRGTGFFPWSSAPVKRLKTTAYGDVKRLLQGQMECLMKPETLKEACLTKLLIRCE